MAGYYRKTVVEMTITTGIDIAAWKNTVNSRIIETSRQKTWRALLLERTPAGSTLHVWAKYSVIYTYN